MAEGQTEKIWLVAQKLAGASEAAELLAELAQKNKLFAAIKDTPNAHLAVIDLTSLDRPSHHKGPLKFQLAAGGIERAMPTLISKPVHVTSGYDGHFERGKPPKPIGTFLGGIVVDNEDGTKTVRAILTLWDDDFPDEVAAIQANKDILGASYEITFRPESARKIADGLVEITEWEFSGGAILRKASAAHPESQVLVAEGGEGKRHPVGTPPPAEHTKGSGGRALKGGRRMKYAGIPEEHHAAVELLIADAVARLKAEGDNERQIADLKEEVAGLKSDKDSMKADHDKALVLAQKATETATQAHADAAAALVAEKAKLAELEPQIVAAKEQLEAATTEATTLKAEKLAAETDKKVETEYAKLAAKHGFDPKDEKLRAQKLPVVKKIVAGEATTFEDIDVLSAGGKPGMKPATQIIPLRAGGADPTQKTPEEIKKLCPTLGKLTAAGA